VSSDASGLPPRPSAPPPSAMINRMSGGEPDTDNLSVWCACGGVVALPCVMFLVFFASL
jgi:hypothetical protein